MSESVIGEIHALASSSCGVFEVNIRCSQERNSIIELVSLLHSVDVLPSVGDIPVEHEGCRVDRGLESALVGSECRSILGPVLNTHGLDTLTGNGSSWGILAEELGVRHGRVVEGDVVIHRAIEVLSV